MVYWLSLLVVNVTGQIVVEIAMMEVMTETAPPVFKGQSVTVEGQPRVISV